MGDDLEVKAILLSTGFPGKTALLRRCCGEDFNYEFDRTTISPSFYQKKIEIYEKIFTLNLWDSNGSEISRDFTKLFIKGSKIVLLVYEITNRNTFDNLNYWYDYLIEIGYKDEIIIGLVGNKTDLYLSTEVTEEEAKKYANSIGAKLKLVSAKTDIKSFNDFLKELLLDYLKKIKFKENNNNKSIKKKISIYGDYNKSELIKLQKYQYF